MYNRLFLSHHKYQAANCGREGEKKKKGRGVERDKGREKGEKEGGEEKEKGEREGETATCTIGNKISKINDRVKRREWNCRLRENQKCLASARTALL